MGAQPVCEVKSRKIISQRLVERAGCCSVVLCAKLSRSAIFEDSDERLPFRSGARISHCR
jgi:hypothetical protein